ncbi:MULTISPECIES: tetratricopeptide repeat protein [unclassified Sphingopyxis]|uniref:tetratricopeptide repeat protein n=1 Tax=unclassified Sphingopyxis TaxID=2614943 RepID=UPI0018D211F5|nr:MULTISPECIES: tetratricopeptide repeat protein [unclassified Sphingopyxis]
MADSADYSASGGQNTVDVANRPSTFCEQINYATGNPELDAMYNAAWSLDNGTDGRVDRERARQLYRDAAQRGHRASQYNYAVMLHRGQGGPVDNPASVYWHQQAANQDDYLATISLAGAYADGWPGVERNYAKALQYSLIAEKCEKGDMTNNIGVIYARGGWGVERDLGTARIWFRKAEVRGSRHASRNLGTIEDGLDNSEILLWDDIGPP